ncbi:MAG: hypothetical protein JWO30_2564 [Fibrobacteres bacterium]|nr:hypothetical protein [Fibrobacterota bacterium]
MVRGFPILIALLLPFVASLPTYAGANVVLGPKTVPREKFIVYLMIGHSNMAGRDINRSDSVTHPRAWNYHWMSDKQWVPAREIPGNLKNGLSGRGCGGGGMPLLKHLVAEYPDYYIGAIDNASLSATVRGSIANNSSGMPGDDNRYIKGSQLFLEITSAAKEVKKDAVLGGIFCQLGTIEATRSNGDICRAFSDDVVQMVKDMRAEIGEPNLPFIMGKYEAGASGTYAVTYPLPKIIAEQILLVPGKLPFSALVESEGLEMLDDHHYVTGPTGQGEWARRAVAIIKEKGFFPSTLMTIRPYADRSRSAEDASQGGARVFLSRSGLTILPWDGKLFRIDGKGWDGAMPAIYP